MLRGMDSQNSTIGIKPKEDSQLESSLFEWNNPLGYGLATVRWDLQECFVFLLKYFYFFIFYIIN
jgi:hypothetical protein